MRFLDRYAMDGKISEIYSPFSKESITSPNRKTIDGSPNPQVIAERNPKKKYNLSVKSA